jgi:hypothetical protein
VQQVCNVTIGAGASLSDAVDVHGLTIAAIVCPAGWDAADITFQASAEDRPVSSDLEGGATFYNVYTEADAEYTVQAGASRFITVDPQKFRGALWVKLRSGTSGVAVNQVDAVTVQVILVPDVA